MLNKALAGQSVTISVLGGSRICLFPSSFYTPKLTYPPVSACHGAGGDLISPTCYPSHFFQWWNIVFPHPASELTSGALRRTNSGYFGYCNSLHLLDQMDLVIIELDMEDGQCVSFRFSSVSFIPPFLFSLLFVIGLLRPPYFMPSYRHPNDGLSHTKQGQPPTKPSHFAHLFIDPLPWLYPFSHLPSRYGHYHLPNPFFPGRVSPRLTHPILHHFPFPRTPCVLKVELELDVRHCVDSSTFDFHVPSSRVRGACGSHLLLL